MGQPPLSGEVATGFGANQNSAAKGVVIQPDGKIIVAGFAGPNGSQEFALARYNSNGSLDNSFDGDGKQTTDFDFIGQIRDASGRAGCGPLLIAATSSARAAAVSGP